MFVNKYFLVIVRMHRLLMCFAASFDYCGKKNNFTFYIVDMVDMVEWTVFISVSKSTYFQKIKEIS
jgi:hypothetical protein